MIEYKSIYLETLRSVLATIGQIPEECPDLRTCLHAFFGHFEHSPALAKMVLRGGIGSDAEAEALLTVFHEHQFALFSQKVGTLTPLSPLIQLGLRGWIRFFQEVCLQWVEHQDIPREQVIDLLEYNLQAILSWPEQQR